MRDKSTLTVVAAMLCIIFACCFSTVMAKETSDAFLVDNDQLSAETVACLEAAGDALPSGFQECEIACLQQRIQCVNAGIDPQLCLNFWRCCTLACYGLNCEFDDMP